MSTDIFEKLKNVDDNNKYTVYGYVRKCESNIFGNITQANPYYRLPEIAKVVCLFYYYDPEALELAFDQYIDPDQNGDIDVEEWFEGIQKLNVQLNDEYKQRKIYNFMDKDESGFIEKEDFVSFATAKFDNEELQSLQEPILEAVRVANLHNRTNRLKKKSLSQDWTGYDMQLLEEEMVCAMTEMVERIEFEVNQELEFENEMKERIEKNPEILDKSNAFKWTKYEVSHWITELGMERYCRYFAQESVDGPMLLEDITQEMLETNLGVLTIHAKKIMREIKTLKKAVRGV